MTTATQKFVQYTLGILLIIVALNAFGGGYYGISGAPNVPVEWLDGSPFQTYLIPSLILFFVVGGSCLTAAILVFRRHASARRAALAAGIVIIGWLTVQVTIIGYVSWMQPATATAAVLILCLAAVYKQPLYIAKNGVAAN